jgi:hypothetical protein
MWSFSLACSFGVQYIVSPALLQKVQEIVSDFVQGALVVCGCRGVVVACCMTLLSE